MDAFSPHCCCPEKNETNVQSTAYTINFIPNSICLKHPHWPTIKYFSCWSLHPSCIHGCQHKCDCYLYWYTVCTSIRKHIHLNADSFIGSKAFSTNAKCRRWFPVDLNANFKTITWVERVRGLWSEIWSLLTRRNFSSAPSDQQHSAAYVCVRVRACVADSP